jgi:hypothetical protein
MDVTKGSLDWSGGHHTNIRSASQNKFVKTSGREPQRAVAGLFHRLMPGSAGARRNTVRDADVVGKHDQLTDLPMTVRIFYACLCVEVEIV